MIPASIRSLGEAMPANTSVELQLLFCAIALGIVQLLLAVLASVAGRGMGWAVGPRDEGWPPPGRGCDPRSSWPGLTRPPIALASASAKDSLRRADARRMGGRIKSGHDEWIKPALPPLAWASVRA